MSNPKKIKIFGVQNFILFLFIFLPHTTNGLKCRAVQEVQQNDDFEYVVRMCWRNLRNESDFTDYLFGNKENYDSSRNKRPNDDMGGNNNNYDSRNYYYTRNQYKNQYQDGFDRFWSHDNFQNDRKKYWSDERVKQDGDYNYDNDYYNPQRNGKDGRRKYKPRPPFPHTFQQQMQHDRDMMMYNNYNVRDSPSYFIPNRNKNYKFNKDKISDSVFSDIEPCIIYCVFKEMKLLDDKRIPSKEIITRKMTQKIRNTELKNFIQEAVEECFEAVDDDGFANNSNNNNRNGNNNNNNNSNNNNSRRRNGDGICNWAKTFAICLEEKGKENCEDWSDSSQKNQNNGRNNGNKNSDDQKHKNERG